MALYIYLVLDALFETINIKKTRKMLVGQLEGGSLYYYVGYSLSSLLQNTIVAEQWIKNSIIGTGRPEHSWPE